MSHYMSADTSRPWVRRSLIALAVLIAIGLIILASGYGYLTWRFGQIPRINLGLGGADNDEPMNVLLVGSDTRALKGDEGSKFGTSSSVGGQRSDTMMILRVDPEKEKASILSIPRDLYVPIADTDRSDRINSAFNAGPKRLIETIEQEPLGIPIHHYVQVDFDGFRGIVNAVGGVKMYFPSPARDLVSGFRVGAGCIDLSGDTALAFVRARNYQTFQGGFWQTDPSADLGRIQRQQDFIRRMIRRAISKGIRNPKTLNSLINTGIDNVTIDEELSSKDVFRLGRRFRSLEPDAVEMLTLPAYLGRSDTGESILRLKQPQAQEVIDRFKGKSEKDATADVPPSAVRVRILNGSGISGQAAQAETGLQAAGFNVADTGDAEVYNYGRTVIKYGAGQRTKALLVQKKVINGSSLQEDKSIKGVDVVLVTGSNFGGIKKGSTANKSGGSSSSSGKPQANKPKSSGAPASAAC